jgi:hygromycin-B 4-O-kinase
MKTTFSEKQFIQIIRRLYPNADNICNMAEGDTSQTYCFNAGNEKFVIQTSRDLQGYRKENYIYNKFHKNINVRKVLKTEEMENNIYYCITEFIDAKRLQDLNINDLKRNVDRIMETFKTMEKINISQSNGFGCFDWNGFAFYRTWSEYINAVYEHYKWNNCNKNTKKIILECISEIKKYNNILDNKRSLIHGDFGSSNALINREKIYLIDWSLSLYGDPLYEMANVLFWNENCLIPLIDEINKMYLNDKKARLKIYIYILRIGLEEIYRTIEQKQIGYNIGWVENRLGEVVNKTSANFA